MMLLLAKLFPIEGLPLKLDYKFRCIFTLILVHIFKK